MSLNRHLLIAVLAMAVVIVASNILVTHPINDWLTWGAITYPFAFLITDIGNRVHGAAFARKVVLAGFVTGVVASLVLADPRIAVASGTAFLVAQLVDVSVFDRLRGRSWWSAPFFSSVVGSVLDTYLFFALAFAGSGDPWLSWATGDLGVKWAVALLALLPYAALFARRGAAADQAR